MDANPGPITLTVSCDHEYLAGFPMLVAVELRNVATNLFQPFEPFEFFNGPGPVEFILRGGAREWTWPRRSRSMEGEPNWVEFGPGKAFLALQDLSELHPDIPPGHYELFARARFGGGVAPSATASCQIRAPSEKDRAAATKLRASNKNKEPSWRAFARQNWSTPDTTSLSASARVHLAYYLYLHRVTYGPVSIAALDPEEPWKFAHGVLESEAALVRLEILRAAHKPEADGVERAVLERWPGLAWRVEELHVNQGLLTVLRTGWGVESWMAPADQPRPYPAP